MTRQNLESEHFLVATLTLNISLPGCRSLKEKRGRLAHLINQLRKEFNLSVSEVGFQDSWQSALIGCAIISNDSRYNQQLLEKVILFVERHFQNEPLLQHFIEYR